MSHKILSSMHRDILLKFTKLHLASGKNSNGRAPCLLYMSVLLVTLSLDIQPNLGFIPPCGSCGAAVEINQNSVQFDGCNFWYHIEYQGMNTGIHQIVAEHSSYSWSCLKFGLPNFSTSVFEDISAAGLGGSVGCASDW